MRWWIASLGFLVLLGCSGSGKGGGLSHASAPVVVEEFPLPTGETLSPAAQEAVERGVKAAERRDWDTAIRELLAAHKQSPWSAPILLNLGIAHGRRGQEVAAIAWLRAYLARVRFAPNADVVRKDIARLHEAADWRIKLCIDAFDPEEGDSLDMKAMLTIYRVMAGDTKGAIQAAKKYPEIARFLMVTNECEALARAGEVEKALNMLAAARRNSAADSIRASYCEHLISLGDLEGARKFAETIGDAHKRCQVEGQLVKQGTLDGAFDVLGRNENADNLRDTLFEACLKVGKLEKARALADGVPGGKFQIHQRSRYLARLAVQQLIARDNAAAKSTARDILKMGEAVISQHPASRDPYEDVEPLFVAHAVLGNAKEARGFARRHRYPKASDYAFGRVAFIQALSGRLDAAEETARIGAKKGAAGTSERCLEAIASACLRRGDVRQAFEGALKTKGAAKTRLLAAVARAQTMSGDLAAAEKSLTILPPAPDSGSLLMDAWLLEMVRLGRAYLAGEKFSNVSRVLDTAQKVGFNANAKFPPELTRAFENLAILQWQFGDGEAAWTTLNRAVSIEAKEWVALAVDLSKSALEREAGLKKSMQGEIPYKKRLETARSVSEFARQLREVRARETLLEKTR